MKKPISEKLVAALRNAEGSVGFSYSPDIADPKSPIGILFQYVAGSRIYRILRTNDQLFQFFYASPGTGTQIATIDLKTFPTSKSSKICFSWSPNFISLGIVLDPPGSFSFGARGVACSYNLQTDVNGSIVQIGDTGMRVTGLRVLVGKKLMLSPPAINAWNETLKAIEVLDSGTSTEGWLFELVVTNLTLTILVTGFEAYLKTRFRELQGEGMPVDIEALVSKFWSKKEREQEPNLLSFLQTSANEKKISLLEYIVQRINFQNYQDAADAYSAGYKLHFSKLSKDTSTIAKLKQAIRFRHRIVHVTPLLPVLNEQDIPECEAIIPHKTYRHETIALFDTFIRNVHDKTLQLRVPSK